jgi:hypothetical protein
VTALVPVHVTDYVETLAVTLSRDLSGGWLLLPADMVARFERARAAFDAAQAEVAEYIDRHGLELRGDEPPEEPW